MRPLCMTGEDRSGGSVSSRNTSCFFAPLTLPMGFSWTMFFCQHVGLQQANCPDRPLSLPVITDCGPPIVPGPNHSVGFQWNFADNVDAVSKGATLSDRCFDGLCGSFRQAGLPVHEVTPGALSAEMLGMRVFPSHCVCGHADMRFFNPSQIGVAHLDVSSSCLRKGCATDCRSSLHPRHCLASATHWMSCEIPWVSLKCELRAYVRLLPCRESSSCSGAFPFSRSDRQ